MLNGQIASASAIRDFARNFALFSTTLAGADPDLRTLIDTGSATAIELRTFLEDNRVELGQLINNLVTTGEVVVKHLDGIEQVLVLYPYVVEGGFTVVSKSPDTGLYDAHFGMIIQQEPHVCNEGYQSTDERPPQDGSNRPMNVDARCAEPPAQSNARGAQNVPRAPVRPTGRRSWRPTTRRAIASTGSTSRRAVPRAPALDATRRLGGESWKWLLIQPLAR